MFWTRFVELCNEAGKSPNRVAAELGLSSSVCTVWKRGAVPRDATMQKLADFFHVTADYLLGNVNDPFFHLDNDRILREINSYEDTSETKDAPLYSSEAMKLAADYDDLDDHGQRIVRLVADEEKARCASHAPVEQAEPENVVYITSWFPMPMSAGTGQPAGSDEPEDLELTKRPPRGTSYVAPISGDSMEPTYHDGDKLFIRACEEIEVGQIGVFLMDGQQWVKERGDGVLISHNPAYPPRPMTEDVRCQGLVLGVCDESYLG